MSATNATVHAERVIQCPFSLAIDYAHELFPQPSDGPASVHAGALAHSVRVIFERELDSSDVGRAHDQLAFGWDAGSRWLPNFRGVLRFRAESSQTRALLEGEYVPPFGALGAFFDRTIGNRLASATARDLLTRLALRLEARWADERRRSLPVT